MRDHCDWWGGKQWVLVGLRYVTTDNGALSVLMQKMRHGVRRMLKLPVGPLDTVELSTQYYTTRKIMSPVLVYTMSYYSKHNTYTYITIVVKLLDFVYSI